MCTAAILAGGQGRRLGGVAKALLRVGGSRIIDRQLATLSTVTNHVAIVASDAALFLDLGVPVWPDVQPGQGPLGGILTALVNSTTTQTVVVAGDMPFLTPRFLAHLIACGRDVDVAIPRTGDGLHPLCASYGPACLTTIRRHLASGCRQVSGILTTLRVHEIPSDVVARLDPEGRVLVNVNTPRDLARARALAESEPSP